MNGIYGNNLEDKWFENLLIKNEPTNSDNFTGIVEVELYHNNNLYYMDVNVSILDNNLDSASMVSLFLVDDYGNDSDVSSCVGIGEELIKLYRREIYEQVVDIIEI